MRLSGYRNIVVLTGAGISHSAGLPIYRGAGGLWSDPELAMLSSVRGLLEQRERVCDLFWRFRGDIVKAEPTPAHRALAAFEQGLPAETRFLIITQNVDGLHQRAGSRSVCEYHGSLARWRCERCGAARVPGDAPGDAVPGHDVPVPACCGERMRPDVVLFGELIPVAAEHAAKQALRDCDLFVAIGTSGTVAPASSFVRWAALNGARTVLLNRELFDGARELFGELETGLADELVPRWFV
ncbi:MAG TPA: Sir2 family NAD-dependent protein deacetylase [Kofleriaceae bacterium]|nr:Sir2 family NAD-dependent protein deacetylase [Kofleriaceae bacterium]